jgi:hypothetical protein
LKDKGLQRGLYNQIANLAITQSDINIAIGAKAPAVYFAQLVQQCENGKKKYGNITDRAELEKNLKSHAIPLEILDQELNYEDFLTIRRTLMAQKIKKYFERISI